MTAQKPEYILHSENSLDLIFSNGEMRTLIRGYHRNFDVIVANLNDPVSSFTEKEVLDLVDYTTSLATMLAKISPHISQKSNAIYFHGKLINQFVLEAMLDCYAARKPYLGAYLRFMENVAENPSEHGQEETYRWLAYLAETQNPFLLTEEGMLIAHTKKINGVSGNLASISECDIPAVVLVDNEDSFDSPYYAAELGSIVEMKYKPAPEDVTFDMEGIAADAWDKASGYVMYRLEIHPKDILNMIESSTKNLGNTIYPSGVQYNSLMVSKILITEIDTVTNPLVNNVIPNPYYGGWLEEEFQQWANLSLPREEAILHEQNEVTFEEALFSKE